MDWHYLVAGWVLVTGLGFAWAGGSILRLTIELKDLREGYRALARDLYGLRLRAQQVETNGAAPSPPSA